MGKNGWEMSFSWGNLVTYLHQYRGHPGIFKDTVLIEMIYGWVKMKASTLKWMKIGLPTSYSPYHKKFNYTRNMKPLGFPAVAYY